MPVAEGKKAPAFTLRDAEGKRHSLGDYAGRDLILYFYPKDDTPGCTKEAQGFRAVHKQLQRRGVALLGVSPDGPESHARFAAKFSLPFPLLCDEKRAVMTRYGAWGEKMMYGKKTTGVLRSTVWIGPDSRVGKHWKRVPKAADHPAKVLEALEAAAG